MGFLSNTKYVGIDIGSEYVKIAAITKTRHGLNISSMVELKTPAQLISSNFKEIDDVFKDKLIALINEHGLDKNSRVIASIGGKNVLVRNFRLPQMPDKEIKQAVQWELTKYINIDPEKMVVDYIVLSNNKEQMELLVFASKDEFLTELYHFLEEVNLTPKEIDMEAMGACYLRVYGEQNSKNIFDPGCWMVMDFGHTKTSVAIFENDQLIFVHSINLTISTDNEEYSHLIYDDLAREIQRIIDYFEKQLKKSQIGSIYITGGAIDSNTVSLLQKRIRTNIQQFPINQIFAGIKLPKEYNDIPAQYLTALGMAVREVIA